MPREIKRLPAKTVERIKEASGGAAFAIAAGLAPSRPAPGKPARLADGDGLYLNVDPSGAARWIYRARWDEDALREDGGWAAYPRCP